MSHPDVFSRPDARALGAVPVGLLAGVLLGGVILLAGSSLKGVLVLVAVGCLPLLLLVLGSMTSVLRGLLIFSISMSLDIYPGFSDRFVETLPGVPISLTAMLLVALFGFGLLEAGMRKPAMRRPAAVTIVFALLVVWAVLSVSVAPRPGYVLQALPGYATSFVLCLYASRLMTSSDGMHFTVGWIGLAVLVSGALACVQYLTGGSPNLTLLGGSETQMVQSYQQGQISRVSGLLRHPNTFAVFLNGFLPLLLVLAFTLERYALRLLCAAAFVLGLIALVLTYSRGGWLSLGVSIGLILLVVPRRHWRPRLATGLLAVSALALLVVVGLTTPLYSSIAVRISEDDQGAASSRVPLAHASLDLIREHPVTGVGLGNYQFAAPLVTDDRGVLLIEAGDGRPMRVHNLFLFTAVELGVPGALLLAAIVTLFLVRGIHVIRRGSTMQSWVALGLTCGLLAIMAHCMLEPATLADPSYLILSFVGGCLTGLGNTGDSHG